MAANKFATMLHKNTHKIFLILVYAVLEWILILLLLLNSLFSYCITKFAKYFGLKPPCPWCTRVDHVLEPGRDTNSYRDLLCHAHATEVSKLSFCSNHQKLAESHLMCEECLASCPNQNDETRRVAFMTWVSTDKLDNGDDEVLSCCSCCKRSLTGKFYPPYMLMDYSSWGILNSAHKGSLILESIDNDTNGSGQCREPSKLCSPEDQAEVMFEMKINNDDNDNADDEGAEDQHHMLSGVGCFGLREEAQECSSSEVNLQCDEKEAYEDFTSGNPNITKQHSNITSFGYNIIQCGFGEEDLLEHINLSHWKCKCDRLIPAELIDLSTNATQGSCSTEEQDHQNETIDSSLQIVAQPDVSEEAALHVMDESAKKSSHGEVESLEIGAGDNESVLNGNNKKHDLVDEANENLIEMKEAIYGNYTETSAMEEPFDPPANQEEKNGSLLSVEEIKPKSLFGSEESEHAANLTQAKEPVPPAPVLQEDQSSTIDNGVKNDNVPDSDTTESDLGTNNIERNTVEDKMISSNEGGINTRLSVYLDPSEAEDEKVSDVTFESRNPLHKKLPLFEKRESGADESLDGSVTTEIEIRDPVKIIEELKASLEAERKALNALYAELEEERSAAAIAANQTMAMITRLQEEKAAMQMEALQYQRMMEEQSEYDQEALQLLNELMLKREKEKQELEKELEICRKKILDYEAKEKMRMTRRSKDGSEQSKSSVSCSNMEDIDELSIDLNREAREEDGSFYGNGESSNDNNPADAVLSLEEMALDCVKHISVLDDSLTEYEEERLSILDQLKVLEEKLLTIADKEFIEDVRAIRHSSTYEVDGLLTNCDSSLKEENEFAEDNHQERKTMVSMAKNLLPLLDAAEETEEEMIHETQLEAETVEMQEYSTSKLDLDSDRLAIIEEVDRVYERLHALEEDREFLKNCVSSIKKGDKGMDLLQEILQHLRDLRAVQLRPTNTADNALE